MFNNILVAYDGSPSSRAAAEQAFELAKANNAQVTVLSVAPSVAPLTSFGGVSANYENHQTAVIRPGDS